MINSLSATKLATHQHKVPHCVAAMRTMNGIDGLSNCTTRKVNAREKKTQIHAMHIKPCSLVAELTVGTSVIHEEDKKNSKKG